MKIVKKLCALSLAWSLVQLSIQPAAAAFAEFKIPSAPIEIKLAGPATQPQILNTTLPSFPTAETTPAIATIPTLATTAAETLAPTAQIMVEAMGAAAMPGMPRAGADINRMGAELAQPSGDVSPYFTGEKKAAGSTAEVPSIGEIGTPSSRLAPSSISSYRASETTPGPRLQSRWNSQRGAVNTAVLVVIGVVAAIAITVGVLWHNSTSKNELWQNSKSNQDIVSIEKARRSSDADNLFTIAKDARERQARMNERIADAKSQGSKKLDDKTSDNLKTGEAYAAFDGLVGMRGEENANAVSKDAAKRVGGELPSEWKAHLSGLDAQAKQTDNEGPLALKLQALRSELGKEDQKAAQFQQDIKTFDDHVPGLFGGRLKDMEAKAQSDLQEFQQTEVGPEHTLYDQYNQAMRSRVSDKLSANDKDFQAHRAHMERLGDAQEAVAPALELAQQVDKDLQEMSSHEHARAFNLLLASQNENVEVDDYDSNGKKTGSHYEDHSFTYKALAASEGSEARASAASAQAGIKALHAILPTLHKNKTLQDEGLLFALPQDPHTSVNGSGSVFFDFWIPASWNFFGTMFTESQAGQARASFAPVLGGLAQVSQEISNRKGGEANWTNQAIDKDLNQQMAQAKQTP